MATTEDRGALSATEAWRDELYEREPERGELFSTISGSRTSRSTRPTRSRSTTSATSASPASIPFTRGVYPSMYRGRLWTMRQFAGFGTADETNERFRYLLEHGQTGLSTAFDMPTLMGYDSDHAALARRGRPRGRRDRLARRHGDALRRHPARRRLDLDDDQLAGRDPARVLRLRRRAAGRAARRRCAGRSRPTSSRSTSRRRSTSSRPSRSMRLVTDMVEWCDARAAADGTRSRSPATTSARRARPRRRSSRSRSPTGSRTSSGRSSAGSTSTSSRRGSRSSSTRTSTSSRRSRSTAPRAGSGRASCASASARGTRARWLMRFHTQTAGVSLTAQQPEVNIVRTAIEALAAVLGGTQSLHTNSFDEALALPTEDAVRIALRTQQVIAHETGVVNTIDPLGGSYYVEELTNELERAGVRVLRPDRRARRRGGRRSSRTSSSARSPRRRSATSSEVERGRARRRRRQPLRARGRGGRRAPARSTRRSRRSRSRACRRCGPARRGRGRGARSRG